MSRHLFDGERQTTVTVSDFSIESGNAIAIVGPSGSGKSTAMEMLALAQIPDEFSSCHLHVGQQSEYLDDAYFRDDQSALATLRRQHFGFIVQSQLLLPYLNVEANISLSAKLALRETSTNVSELLESLSLSDQRHARPSNLSVGQRQRVSIARALASKPEFILADEPTSALDDALSRQVLHLLKQTAVETGRIVMVITHDEDAAIEAGLEICKIQHLAQNKTVQSVLSRPVAEIDLNAKTLTDTI